MNVNHSLPRERQKEREREAGVVKEHLLVRVSFAFHETLNKSSEQRDCVEACVCLFSLSLTVYQQDSVLCYISKSSPEA